ncbi:MAG TPA: hypothetical protein VD861_06365, partial [Pyrinomonadaceae bacterium]|nr:hypothetical protein [Pyrinomonadaceae bacterium]
LDNADSPAPFGAQGLSNYNVKIMASQDNRLLVYKRNFFFGSGGGIERLLYEPAVYPQLKSYFDTVHKSDGHTITLKQAASTASN